MKYLARRPNLNRARQLFAYELHFRDGMQNSCEGLDLELGLTTRGYSACACLKIS